ncbi:107-domain-containing protein [Suillus clintonianus]|uniref:107-domain-containing protein n=1 Tax=Suillus clintonianus TaxID=1904413 RepID=UPI001B879FE7|nr:107-domain-containing protein [Suillus clintonianus]KAG2120267.1 107-domain-containing protein [Suillus clintonianus]
MQKEYGAFADNFVTVFAPEILKVYLHQVELYVSGRIKPKSTCILLKPHVDSLVAKLTTHSMSLSWRPSIILDRTSSLLETFATELRDANFDPESSYRYPTMTRFFMMRFFAHLCLYLQTIDIPVPPLATQVILEAYLQVLEAAGQRELIAMYAVPLGDNAVERYAMFLTLLELTADVNDRRLALTRAREHGLDVHKEAVVAAKQTIDRAFESFVIPLQATPSDIELLLLRSIEWTTFEDGMHDTALEQVTVILRYFLGAGSVLLAKNLVEMLPQRCLYVSLASRWPLVARFALVVVPILIRNSHSSRSPIIACFLVVAPAAESAGPSEESHVPTVDRVDRVFSGVDVPPPPPSSSSSEDGVSDREEELEAVDFADMGKMFPNLGTAKASTKARQEKTFCWDSFIPSSSTARRYNEKPVLVSTDAVISETTAITVHSSTALEHSTAALVITQDDDIEILIDKPDPIPSSTTPISNETTASPACLPEGDTPTFSFFVDTEPTKPFAHRSASDVVLFDRTAAWGGAPFGAEDELIVYVAPHPRSGRASLVPPIPRVRLPTKYMLTGTNNPMHIHPVPVAHESIVDNQRIPAASEAPQFSSVSFDFGTPTAKKQSHQIPVFTPGDHSKARAQARRQDARVARNRAQRHAMFGSFGAILSEARLRDADERERKDIRWETRRRGDDDIDWGDDDIDWGDDDEDGDGSGDGSGVPENDGVDEVSNGLGGMDLDPDLEPSLEAMKGFVHSMSAEGSRYRTMDDIEDEQRMRIEDEEEDDGSDSHGSYSDTSDEEDKEEKAVFEVEEDMLVAESEGGKPHEPLPSGDSDEGEDSSDDDELSPGGNFKARLHRLREKSRSTKPATAAPAGDSEGDEEDDASFPRWNRGDSDNDYIAGIEEMLEMHSGIVGSKDRKMRKKLFRAILNASQRVLLSYRVYQSSNLFSERKKENMKELPADLQEIWKKDRAKKAELTRAREQARLTDAVDPISPKKGGKKGRKAMRAAAKMDPSELAEIQNAIIDMVSLEKQIRRFISDEGGKNNMVLPPMNKASRKEVHELANSFNLKSQSKGKEDWRYITLIKSTKTRAVDEHKVKNVMKRHGGRFDNDKMPRHKDGDEVGKAAPKIGETNVGFKDACFDGVGRKRQNWWQCVQWD